MKLPKNLIKKYGITKKAWAVFKGKSSPRGKTMARRKRKGFRKKGSSSSFNFMGMVIGAGVYGALREKLSNMLQPVTSAIPLGNVADEVVLLTAGYFVAKKTSGVFRDIGKAAVTIEAARLGQAVASGELNLGGGSSSNSSSW